jgi:hypothetical protein
MLNREFDDIVSILEPLMRRKVLNTVIGFVTADDDASLIKKYITRVEQAVADYQVCFGRCITQNILRAHQLSLMKDIHILIWKKLVRIYHGVNIQILIASFAPTGRR